MVEIRCYQLQDYHAVREILEEGGIYWEPSDSEQALRKKVREHPDSILVATKDDRVVGTQFISADFLPFLFRLAVHPDYRGEGIGMELIHEGEKILRSKGCNHVNILVAAEDVELQGFYEKQGYEKGHTYRWMTKEF